MGNNPANRAAAAPETDATVLPVTPVTEDVVHPAIGFVKSTAILTSSAILRIALVFAQQTVLAAAFGARMEMDAFLAATTIPTLIMGVLIEQLNVTLIPIVVKYRTRNGTAESAAVVSSIINLAFVVLVILVLIGIVSGNWIISLTVPGFGSGSHTFFLATLLFRALLPSVIFSGLAGLMTGVFYAEKRYGLTSVASILNCLITLIVTLVSVRSLGIIGAVIGLLAGAFVQFAVLFGALLKDKRYFLRLNFRHPGVLKVVHLAVPLVGCALLYKASPVVDRFIASGLPEGSIAFLGYAFRIVNTLLILVTQGVAVSFFPILSERVASDDMEGVKRTLYSGIEVLTFVIAPVAAALVVFGKPAIQLLLERGAFTYEATIGTNTAVLCYLGYLFAGAIGSIQTYVFYSLQDTSAIFKVTAITILPQIALSVFLSNALGFVGLALSLSAIAVANMMLFAAILHRRLKGIAVNRMIRSQIKVWFSGFAMAVISLGMNWLLSGIVEGTGEGIAMRAAALIFSAATGIASFLILTWLLKCEGLHYFRKGFTRLKTAESR